MFSCFARSLNKVSARSVPGLQASSEKSFNGVTVHWVRSVVDNWNVISSRWMRNISLSRSYSFEFVKHQGRPMMRVNMQL